ncbi:hypothetical protein BKA81DRAFT_119672 [Phyllosticta paracitricarpa]
MEQTQLPRHAVCLLPLSRVALFSKPTLGCDFSSPSRLFALSLNSARHDVKNPTCLVTDQPQTRQVLMFLNTCSHKKLTSQTGSPKPTTTTTHTSTEHRNASSPDPQEVRHQSFPPSTSPPPHLPTNTPNPTQRPSPHPPRPPDPPHPRLPATPAHPAHLHHSRLLDGVSHRLHARRRRRHVGQSVRCGGAADGRVCGAGAVLCMG